MSSQWFVEPTEKPNQFVILDENRLVVALVTGEREEAEMMAAAPSFLAALRLCCQTGDLAFANQLIRLFDKTNQTSDSNPNR